MKQSRGFSLVEMMLAVLMIGIGLVSLLSVTGSALQVARATKELDQGCQLLDRLHMEQPLQLEEDLEEGEFDGEFEGEGLEKYRWFRIIEVVGVEEDRLFKITERVTWEIKGEEWAHEEAYLLHGPTAKKEGFVHEDASGWDE